MVIIVCYNINMDNLLNKLNKLPKIKDSKSISVFTMKEAPKSLQISKEDYFKIIEEGGVLAIICPCMWTRQYFTYPLVKFVNAQTDILYISEPSEDYFESADVLCSIYLFRKIKDV